MSRVMTGDRLRISIFGRRNAGKSSLINAFTGQNVAIVSDVPGTTTDPVMKAIELFPTGPAILIDTAGLDDTGDALGLERVKKSVSYLKKSDMVILVVDASGSAGELEDNIITECENEKIPLILVLNKSELTLSERVKTWLEGKEYIAVSALNNEGIGNITKKITELSPDEWEPPFLRDLINPGDVVLMITPIDSSAPKGRMIMPQVRAWRDILDGGGIALSCEPANLQKTLDSLKSKPALVVTDSQVFSKVAPIVPEDVPFTSFSILSIRQKGNLAEMVKAVKTVENLKAGDKVLIAESCSHHSQDDDIARVKIPKWLNDKVGGGLVIETSSGRDYPENLSDYKLIVHCGACTLNRREMLLRQAIPAEKGVPVTNFGVLISYLHGVFPRALKPFGIE
ncbi:[FeFe] hydrogenase H-cluster maturation GTPase HydF [bacterium]|nr:[FeFe] hydrogenase H-cluster maturation GTPase HydF [bacterium]